MGIVLDTSVLVAAERRARSVRQILESLQVKQPDDAVALSVITVAELTHGAYRAKTEQDQQRRLNFVDEFCRDVPVHPVTLETARLAGRIAGQQGAKGIQLAFEDLLIGSTALILGYSVATLNVRDFQRIPGLSVVQL